MSVQKDSRYTKEHEWVRAEGSSFRVGITDYAQQELGDVVFIDLPEVGKILERGKSFATVESVKAVSDIYAPLDGKVIEINTALANTPELINQSPLEDAWIAQIEVSDPEQLEQLLSANEYQSLINELAK